jgi:hypothetical protein
MCVGTCKCVCVRYSCVIQKDFVTRAVYCRSWDRYRLLYSNRCRPLYGVQSRINAGLSTAKWAVSSVAMQQYSCKRVCRFYGRFLRSGGQRAGFPTLWVYHARF